jgi:hypothetical protein
MDANCVLSAHFLSTATGSNLKSSVSVSTIYYTGNQ